MLTYNSPQQYAIRQNAPVQGARRATVQVAAPARQPSPVRPSSTGMLSGTMTATPVRGSVSPQPHRQTITSTTPLRRAMLPSQALGGGLGNASLLGAMTGGGTSSTGTASPADTPASPMESMGRATGGAVGFDFVPRQELLTNAATTIMTSNRIMATGPQPPQQNSSAEAPAEFQRRGSSAEASAASVVLASSLSAAAGPPRSMQAVPGQAFLFPPTNLSSDNQAMEVEPLEPLEVDDRGTEGIPEDLQAAGVSPITPVETTSVPSSPLHGESQAMRSQGSVATTADASALFDLEDLYTDQAAGTKTAARAEAAEDALASLRTELLEETAIAAQLQANEDARRKLQQARSERAASVAAGASGAGLRRPPTPPTPTLPPHLAEAQQERSMAKQLEQRAWRAQNAFRASEAHEDLLQAHGSDLQRRLEEAEMALRQFDAAPKIAESGSKLQGVSEEAKQLPALEAWEADWAERVRQGAEEEVKAQQTATRLKNRVLDLSSECGMLWLGFTVDDSHKSEEALYVRALQEHVFPGESLHPASLDEILLRLEEESKEICTDLQFGHRLAPAERLERDHVDFLASELAEIQAEASAHSERAALTESELAVVARELRDVDDRLSEALSLRRENEVLRRQQQEWQRSQLRMLRLIEDMQRQRARGVQSQALVAQRLSELQRSLPLRELGGSFRGYPTSRSISPYSSPPRSRASSRQLSPGRRGSPGRGSPGRGSRRVDAICCDNVSLQGQIRKLELEKEDLIKGQQDLISLVKSKMPQLEDAMFRSR